MFTTGHPAKCGPSLGEILRLAQHFPIQLDQGITSQYDSFWILLGHRRGFASGKYRDELLGSGAGNDAFFKYWNAEFERNLEKGEQIPATRRRRGQYYSHRDARRVIASTFSDGESVAIS